MEQQTNPGIHQANNTVENVNGIWHRRLRLRKSSDVSFEVKKQTKRQKKGDSERSGNQQTVDELIDTSSRTLTFIRSDSKDCKRKSTSFHCDMCSFATSEFTSFQEHQRTHRPDKLSYESLDILHTSSLLTKHYDRLHCLDSRHPCKKFKFDTKESSDCTNSMMHGMGNTDRTSNDAVVSPKKEEFFQNIGSVCNRKWGRKNWWKRKEVPPTQPDHDNTDIKYLIPKTEIPWPTSEFLPFSSPGLLDENGELLNPVRILEETEQFLERTVNKAKKWPVVVKGPPSLSCAETFPSEPNINQHTLPRFPTLPFSEKNNLCGLMEKNNISVPPNCTTKVVGFKMVDGRKHLIVKVIPLPKTKNPSDAGRNTVPLSHEDTYAERPSNQICNGLGSTCTESSFLNQEYNSTSSLSSVHPDDQGLGEKQHGGSSVVVSQGGDKQHGCLENSHQLAISRDPEDQSSSPSSVFRFNTANEDEGNVSMTNILTRCKENREATEKLGLYQEQAKRDEGNQLSRVSSIGDDLSSTISLSPGILGEAMSPKHLAVASDNDRYLMNTNMPVEKPTIVPASLAHSSQQTSQHISSFPAFPDSGDLFQRIIEPTIPSFQKSTTESVYASLLFQDRGDEYKNSTDLGHSQLPPGQDCTVGAVEEAYVALPSEEDSFHNADLNQTLEELTFTTHNCLINNAENTFRSNANELADLCRVSTSRVGTCPLKAIPDSSQSNLQSTQDPTTKSSEKSVIKSRMQDAAPRSKEPELQSSMPYWEQVPPATERTLKLMPVYSSQPVKVPRLNQPVVVLNHPDTDIPEVASIMRSVQRHKEAVQKVLLSQGTVKALTEFNCEPLFNSTARSFHSRLVRPQGTVKERFILKLKLRRCGGKFEVAPSGSEVSQLSFRCWFCGRVFRTQESWIGHGQRHLMEATRDWSKFLDYNIVL